MKAITIAIYPVLAILFLNCPGNQEVAQQKVPLPDNAAFEPSLCLCLTTKGEENLISSALECMNNRSDIQHSELTAPSFNTMTTQNGHIAFTDNYDSPISKGIQESIVKIDSCFARGKHQENTFHQELASNLSIAQPREQLFFYSTQMLNIYDSLGMLYPNLEFVSNKRSGPRSMVVSFEKINQEWIVHKVHYASERLYSIRILNELVARMNTKNFVVPESVTFLRLPIQYYTLADLEPWSVFEVRLLQEDSSYQFIQ